MMSLTEHKVFSNKGLKKFQDGNDLSFNTLDFPIIGVSWNNALLSADLVAVEPMNIPSPTGVIYYLDYQYTGFFAEETYRLTKGGTFTNYGLKNFRKKNITLEEYENLNKHTDQGIVYAPYIPVQTTQIISCNPTITVSHRYYDETTLSGINTGDIQ